MATVIHGVSGIAELNLRDRLRHPLELVSAWLVARRQSARIRRELNLLDERDLRDLGISRYDFDAIAEGRLSR
jgi:uncharacterized protein YjiS (DUF1127 family)